jgi:hypothetical protein
MQAVGTLAEGPGVLVIGGERVAAEPLGTFYPLAEGLNPQAPVIAFRPEAFPIWPLRFYVVSADRAVTDQQLRALGKSIQEADSARETPEASSKATSAPGPLSRSIQKSSVADRAAEFLFAVVARDVQGDLGPWWELKRGGPGSSTVTCSEVPQVMSTLASLNIQTYWKRSAFMALGQNKDEATAFSMLKWAKKLNISRE